jgi:hypothetical protein
MRKDIGEKNNVAAAHPDVVRRMREIMEEAREGSPFTQFWPLPEWNIDVTISNWTTIYTGHWAGGKATSLCRPCCR